MNTVILLLLAIFLVMKITALVRREPRNIDDENPYLHPEVAEKILPADMVCYVSPHASHALHVINAPRTLHDKFHVHNGVAVRKSTTVAVYEKLFKPLIDVLLSFFGLLVLSPVFIAVTIAIKLDDPGPVFFTQKRVGKDKRFFALHKFRSMAMNTPHDMPTHLLANPEQYITRVGRFLRRSSLDEIPQIWDIFRGKMSIVGPRPALWNQADLVSEREKWGANSIMPGLTGLAQIHGRDELEIEKKARLDGIYTRLLHSSNLRGFLLDLQCFFGTFLPVLRSEGVVEGKNFQIQASENSKASEASDEINENDSFNEANGVEV